VNECVSKAIVEQYGRIAIRPWFKKRFFPTHQAIRSCL